MSATYLDREVERYLGFESRSACIQDSRSFSTVTPGRIQSRCNRDMPKRPASVCSISNPGRVTPGLSAEKCITESKRRRTPNKSASLCKKSKTPSRTQTPKTPKESDRFIPPRGSMNFSSSHHKIMQAKLNDTDENEIIKTRQNGYQSLMSENLTRILADSNTRVLQYQSKVGSPMKGSLSPTKGTSSCCSPSKKMSIRKIPTVPERVLDAPNYVDDYYLNLLHWSPSINLLAVALDSSVYIWNPANGDIDQLCEVNDSENYVSSLQWIQEGSHLAIGTVNGSVQLWDTERKKRLRQMSGHAARVSSLSWNSHLLSSGSRSGEIHNHDVRVAEHHISSFTAHNQEVCGLTWSPSGRYLASGSNNNKVIIWDSNSINQDVNDSPNNNFIHCFNQHTAAVKALAWCPWQHHMLASGGGSADKSIRFWNINSGNCMNTIETNSQVSSLLWHDYYKEIVSGHGYPNNQLTIWQYPSMTKKADLLGHTCRVLQMTMSTDKTRIMSAAADETLQLWHCFEQTQQQKKEKLRNKQQFGSILSLSSNIR